MLVESFVERRVRLRAHYVFVVEINECTLRCDGISPARKLASVGEQTGLLLIARLKSIQLAAGRSMFGVRMSLLLWHVSIHAP